MRYFIDKDRVIINLTKGKNKFLFFTEEQKKSLAILEREKRRIIDGISYSEKNRTYAQSPTNSPRGNK